MMNKMRVVLADGHASVRQMLQMVLTLQGDYTVVGEAGNGVEALHTCREAKPELLIMDLALSGLPALEVMRSVQAELEEVRILIFSGITCREITKEALRMQPHGFVHKQDHLKTFQDALQAVAFGCVFHTRYARSLLEESCCGPSTAARLTPREQAVLQMVAESRSSKQMAAELGVAVKTIDHYRAQLMSKLNIHNVAGLTRYAVSSGFVRDWSQN